MAVSRMGPGGDERPTLLGMIEEPLPHHFPLEGEDVGGRCAIHTGHCPARAGLCQRVCYPVPMNGPPVGTRRRPERSAPGRQHEASRGVGASGAGDGYNVSTGVRGERPVTRVAGDE